jgi:hypothetical protein
MNWFFGSSRPSPEKGDADGSRRRASLRTGAELEPFLDVTYITPRLLSKIALSPLLSLLSNVY